MRLGEAGVRNALTIDVEDYFHVAALAAAIDRRDWERCERRVERNTRRLLELLDEHGLQATFFVLGWVAERYPGLVRELAAAGHEIASHGYSEEHTSELQSRENLVCRLLLEKKKKEKKTDVE